jgi:signal transduction histidine kinase
LLTGRQIADACILLGIIAGPMLNVLLTLGAAFWVVRRAGVASHRQGLWIGLLSVLNGVIVVVLCSQRMLLFDGMLGLWTPAMLLLAGGSGWLGGRLGQAAQAEQKALFQAGQAINAADSPQAVVAAVGKYLAGLEVSQVSLWEVTQAQSPEEVRLVASWGEGALSPGLCLDATEIPSLAQLSPGAPFVIHSRRMPSAERATWERLGMRTALLMPLSTVEDAPSGLLLVASRTASGLRRCIQRTQLLIAQVALALENIRLVEQVRQAAILDERQRLAREVHDTLAQGLSSIVIHLEAAEAALPAKAPDGTETSRQHLAQARQTARDSLAQSRRLVWALRPQILEHTTLATAVERVVARWAEECGIRAQALLTGTVCSLPPEVEVTLLRATQEALANARKHAQAGQVVVTLSYMADLIILDVRDDGVGFDPTRLNAPSSDEPSGGFGLLAMRERVEQLGGTLLIESSAGEGTTLAVELPLIEGSAS